ncbi:hypothetical protein GCM10023169_01900 [Georgenia halophila]|uniref:Sulfotransferase domain-containing protein n=1 Tax=Georgenia halophila TaxID=620889 RepID=A0ABP8KST4_9MICO
MTLDFIILGAQKAATTSVQDGLRKVPGVYMPARESPFFEDPEFEQRPWLAMGSPSTVNGIKRPDILCRQDILARVSKALPEARFIVVLREPISRAVSAHYHLVRHARLPYRTLNGGMRVAVDRFHGGEVSTLTSVIQFGLYGRFLRQWFDHFPRERFLLLSQRAVLDDFEGVISACCRHLRVPIPKVLPAAGQPKNVGMYDERLLRLHQLGHRLKTRDLGWGDRRKVSANPAARVAGHALTKLAVRASSPGTRPAALERDVRKALEEIYSPDLEALSGLVGGNAIDWTYDSSTRS